VAFFVGSVTTGKASHRETVRLMRNMGMNLRIVPRQTDMTAFWDKRFSDYTIPQEHVKVLAHHKKFTANHLLATLTRKVSVRRNGREFQVLLTGIAPEYFPPGKEKPSMSFEIERGRVYVGYQLAQDMQLQRGETLEIGGKQLVVERCLAETGTPEGDDIRIQCNILDAQEILDLPDQINEIKAIDCMCLEVVSGESREETVLRLRSELQKALPDIEVFQWQTLAQIRHDQRLMMQRYFATLVLPSVAVVCVLWIGVLTMINVRERRQEIGILRALGYGGGKVASLFLGKALLIGLIGAGLGFLLGTELALTFGPQVFRETAKGIKPLYDLLIWSLLAAPMCASLASFVPTMIAVTQDPAQTLREE